MEVCTSSTLSISRFCTACGQLYSQVFRGSILRVHTFACSLGVPFCSYSRYSQYLGLLSTHYIWAFSVLAVFWPPVLQYSQYSDCERNSVLRVLGASICETFMLPLALRNVCFWGKFIYLVEYSMCCFVLSRSQSPISQPRPPATNLCVPTFTRHVLNYSSGAICSASIPNYRQPLHIVVFNSNDPTIIPQTVVSPPICVCVQF